MDQITFLVIFIGKHQRNHIYGSHVIHVVIHKKLLIFYRQFSKNSDSYWGIDGLAMLFSGKNVRICKICNDLSNINHK
jgi:hypothetical protein